MYVSLAHRIGDMDLPLSTETSETVYGKVGCVGDHRRCGCLLDCLAVVVLVDIGFIGVIWLAVRYRV